MFKYFINELWKFYWNAKCSFSMIFIFHYLIMSQSRFHTIREIPHASRELHKKIDRERARSLLSQKRALAPFVKAALKTKTKFFLKRARR